MFKKFKSVVLSIIAIFCVMTVLTSTAFALGILPMSNDDGETVWSDDYGWTKVYRNESVKASGNNTGLGSLPKAMSGSRLYSRVRLYVSSDLEYMYFWVMDSNENWESNKVQVYVDDVTSTKIPYTNNPGFTNGENIYLWGEQFALTSKNVSYKFFSF